MRRISARLNGRKRGWDASPDPGLAQRCRGATHRDRPCSWYAFFVSSLRRKRRLPSASCARGRRVSTPKARRAAQRVRRLLLRRCARHELQLPHQLDRHAVVKAGRQLPLRTLRQEENRKCVRAVAETLSSARQRRHLPRSRAVIAAGKRRGAQPGGGPARKAAHRAVIAAAKAGMRGRRASLGGRGPGVAAYLGRHLLPLDLDRHALGHLNGLLANARLLGDGGNRAAARNRRVSRRAQRSNVRRGGEHGARAAENPCAADDSAGQPLRTAAQQWSMVGDVAATTRSARAPL